MGFLKAVLAVFLFPGNLVIRSIGITPEQDGGIVRSTVNMIVWGLVMFAILVPTVIMK